MDMTDEDKDRCRAQTTDISNLTNYAPQTPPPFTADPSQLVT